MRELEAAEPVSTQNSEVRLSQVYLQQRAIRFLLLSLGATLWAAGCSHQAAPAAAQPAPQQWRLTATIQDLMEGQIDPSADALWDSVAYIAGTTGVEDRQPRTDEQWKAVRTSAVTLIEATNLLSMAGRQVAATDPPPGLGELSHPEIQQRVTANHDSFVQFARSLQDAGLQALAAIDAKNPQALMDAGGTIDQACEACHVTFWYPNQSRRGN
jgi:hypothetical protein